MQQPYHLQDQVMTSPILVEHPLIKRHVTELRSTATPPADFRNLVSRLAALLAYEATKDLKLMPVEVETPMAKTTGHQLSESIGIVPILRAGLGMVEPVLDFLPSAEVWHLGLYRDESTAEPVEYYSRLSDGHPVDVALVLDPMLATGGSAIAALETLKRWGAKRTKILSIIASEFGIQRIAEESADTQVYVCAIDPILNDDKFIVPGLGDAGDRIFNTYPTE